MAFNKLLYKPSISNDGHLLFANDKGQVSICDWSGDTPDTADDGPLIVEPGTTVTITFLRGRFVFVVPVTVAREEREGRVWLEMPSMKALAKLDLNLKFEFDDVSKELLQKVDVARKLRDEGIKRELGALLTITLNDD